MNDILTAFAGYGLAALMTVIAFFCWRKALGLHTLLTETSARFDVLRKQGQTLEKELGKATEKLQAKTDALQRLEKQQSSHKQKKDDDSRKLLERAAHNEETLKHLELQNEHLKTQTEAFLLQLKEYDADRKELQTKLAYTEKTAAERLSARTEPLREEIELLKKKLSAQEGESKSLRDQLTLVRKQTAEIDPEAVNTLKRRAHHFESLYKSMRGLREMSDERNKNWEVALRRMAHWILQHTGAAAKSKADPMLAPIGPLVGQALEIVGAQLVNDDEVFSPGDPAASEVLLAQTVSMSETTAEPV